MFMFKRGNGYYYIVYADETGKKKVISAKTKNKGEATYFLTNIRQELKKRKKHKFIPISLLEFRNRILKRSELYHSEKTTKVYLTTFKYFIEYFGNVQIVDIDKSKIKEYLESRLVKTSIYAARKDLINLKASFNIALDEKLIGNNPCIGIKQFPIPERQPMFLTRDDFEKLNSVIDNIDFKDLVNLAINTGMRQMELLTLTWLQIDFNNKLIKLDNRNHVTKSKRVRTIPINEKAYKILARRSSNNGTENVFDFLEHNTASKISHTFKSYVIKAKINPKYHFHTLRHTFASWLVQNNVSIYTVSKLLGHADIKTTEIYAHLNNGNLMECLERL